MAERNTSLFKWFKEDETIYRRFYFIPIIYNYIT